MPAAKLTLQKWGNSLALRIPKAIARGAHFHVGTSVELTIKKGEVIVRPTGEHKLTLNQRLELFDPQKHGGEAMVVEPVGAEKL